MKKTLFIGLLIPLLVGCSHTQIHRADSLESVLSKAHPGDTLVVRNGVYHDMNLRLTGHGEAGRPIVIMAQNPGEVVLSGASSLRLAGEYVEVNGFCFRDGYSPEGAVVEFRNGDEVANHCRLTNCAIYYYNPDDRKKRNNWVLLYGRDNSFDRNTLVGKLNPDVTLAVILDEERNQENHHQIKANYFGYRPILGSNGGETIRIGTSHQAFSSSRTEVVGNIFEHCDGEVEVVSIKSSDNRIADNLFLECSGVLALRHGNRNTVEHNAFVGDDKPNTGGIRVVNEGHLITNNLFYKLKGTRFFGALGLMNAVPNSLPNRYHHVQHVRVENNCFVDCDNIYWGVGADSERTEAPSDITVSGNTFFHTETHPLFQACSDIRGFCFADNRFNYSATAAPVGYRYDATLDESLDLSSFPQMDQVGVTYALSDQSTADAPGRLLRIGADDLANISLQPNDTLLLTDTLYLLKQTLTVNTPIVLKADSGLNRRPVFRFEGNRRATFITLVNGGSLQVIGLAFDGRLLPGKAQAIGGIETKEGMITPYDLFVDNCEFMNFNESGFAAVRGRKSTFAPRVEIANSYFHDMSGEGISFADERDDKGIYSVEHLFIEDCTFSRLLSSAINVYRGGNDESTSGPYVEVRGCRFDTVNNREQGSAVRLIGAQTVRISDCTFADSGMGGASIRFDEMRWDDIALTNIDLQHSGRIASFWGNLNMKQITTH